MLKVKQKRYDRVTVQIAEDSVRQDRLEYFCFCNFQTGTFHHCIECGRQRHKVENITVVLQ